MTLNVPGQAVDASSLSHILPYNVGDQPTSRGYFISFILILYFTLGRWRFLGGLRYKKKWCRVREMLEDYNHII